MTKIEMKTMPMTRNFTNRTALLCAILFSFIAEIRRTPIAAFAAGAALLSFSREQRIDAHSGLGRQFFKTASFNLVLDEYPALLFRQLLQRILELLDQHCPRLSCFRPSIRRRQEFF